MDEPRSRGWTSGAGGLLAVLVFYFAVPVSTSAPTARLVIGVAVALLAVGAMGFILIRESAQQLRSGRIGLKPRQLLLLVEIVLVGFSLAYYMLAQNTSDQLSGLHTRIDGLYFSMTTMATVGFGDIHAVGQLARVMVTLQMAFNLAFLAGFANLLRLAWQNAAESGAGPPRRLLREGRPRARLANRRAARRRRDPGGPEPRPRPGEGVGGQERS